MSEQKKQLPTFLKVNDVARLVGRSTKTVYQWVSDNKIPYTKLPGDGVVFDLAKLTRWLDEHSFEPPKDDKKTDKKAA